MGLLVVVETLSRDVGPREVGQMQVAHSEEGQLEAVLALLAVVQVPRVVPPFHGGGGMRAVVARERERASRSRRDGESEQGG